MKAVVYREYGSADVLQLEEIDKPAPADDEVLIRVGAASVNPLDWHFMRGTPYPVRIVTGLGKPRVARLGVDVAGQVEEVGKNVTAFEPGDQVFGSCRGAFADYVCTAEKSVVMKPWNVTTEQAAAAPVAGLTALQGLRDKGGLREGKRVLINGAAGGVGTMAVQIARAFGADVTGVCSGGNAGMVRSVGAHRVINYEREDFTKNGQLYDLILDCVGNHPLGDCRRTMKPGGVHVMAGADAGRWMLGPLARSFEAGILSRTTSRKSVGMLTALNQTDLTTLQWLMETGKVLPEIGRRYALSQVPDAVRYLEGGHASGKVVIVMNEAAAA
jgi:NADPH:quinone reductase-like Zn-dependent oxidoreductase